MPVIEFEWDDVDNPAGNVAHLAERHGITPDDVEEAMADPRRFPAPAYSMDTERRRGMVGATTDGRILFVVYTQRGNKLRVISARRADDWQQRQYRRRRRA